MAEEPGATRGRAAAAGGHNLQLQVAGPGQTEGAVVLVVKGLVKRFGGFTAVNKVSFKVDQGEILGLIGPNGSGKSTIFNMLSGTLVPSAGSMKFAGAELAGLAPHRIINPGIGPTFQIPRPFHPLTMFENVAFAGSFWQGRQGRPEAEAAADSAPATVLPPSEVASDPSVVEVYLGTDAVATQAAAAEARR